MKNLFDTDLSGRVPEEYFDTILESGALEKGGFRLERIVSQGCPTPSGQWYDQAWNEWVMLARGEALLEYNDGSTERMTAGDHLLIPAGRRHRVASVSADCVWLALHYGAQHEK